MIEKTKDIWQLFGDADAICITTNGFVTRDGRCVMGRGTAWQAKEKFPGIDKLLGKLIRQNGNKVQIVLRTGTTDIVAFPVKPEKGRYPCPVVTHMQGRFKVGQMVPGWAMKADLAIIERSARELRQLADRMSWKRVVLPRPGCGAGELSWEEVKPVLERHLDQRFIIVRYEWKKPNADHTRKEGKSQCYRLPSPGR